MYYTRTRIYYSLSLYRYISLPIPYEVPWEFEMEQFVYSPKTLGIAIQRQRKAKKLNQQDAGKAFKLKQATVSSIESGALGTRIDTLFRLLAALDLEMIIRSKDEADSIKKGAW